MRDLMFAVSAEVTLSSVWSADGSYMCILLEKPSRMLAWTPSCTVNSEDQAQSCWASSRAVACNSVRTGKHSFARALILKSALGFTVAQQAD